MNPVSWAGPRLQFRGLKEMIYASWRKWHLWVVAPERAKVRGRWGRRWGAGIREIVTRQAPCTSHARSREHRTPGPMNIARQAPWTSPLFAAIFASAITRLFLGVMGKSTQDTRQWIRGGSQLNLSLGFKPLWCHHGRPSAWWYWSVVLWRKPQEGKRDIYIKYIHHKGKGWTNMNTGRKKGHTLT